MTIKSPEIPLTPREQEARLLTRDYAANFATTLTHLIDDARHGDTDPAIKVKALRLKLGAVTEVTRASTGLSPIGSLLDTWAFSVQLRDFLNRLAPMDERARTGWPPGGVKTCNQGLVRTTNRET